MREHEGGETGIAHGANVCTGITQATQSTGVVQHFANGIKVARVVIEDGEVNQTFAIACTQVIVNNF